jgi:hypothetical protein
MADIIGALAPAAPAPTPTVDSCAAGGDDSCTDPVTAQNLRIAAVFIILASSTLGIWLPVIAGEKSYLQKPLAHTLALGKYRLNCLMQLCQHVHDARCATQGSSHACGNCHHPVCSHSAAEAWQAAVLKRTSGKASCRQLQGSHDVHCAGKISPYAATGSPIFFMLKAFGAGVILATGFIHMWPSANSSFSNPCLGEGPPLCITGSSLQQEQSHRLAQSGAGSHPAIVDDIPRSRAGSSVAAVFSVAQRNNPLGQCYGAHLLTGYMAGC